MTKHKLYTIILTVFFALLFYTCKKYDDSGFVFLSKKHLFGGSSVGSNKTWKLKYYEVNGIDSTNVIQGPNNIPDFYEKFINFKLTDHKYLGYKANTFMYEYHIEVDKAYKQILIGYPSTLNLTKEDSAQSAIIGNTLFFSRNLFFPEYNNYAKLWDIKKLTNSELILVSNWHLKNSYKITLTH